MAGYKEYYFHPNSLLRLLTHYTDGAVPMRGECLGMMTNRYLGRTIGLLVESDEWDTPQPLHIRYDGKRIATWTQDGAAPHMEFNQKEDTPVRQN